MRYNIAIFYMKGMHSLEARFDRKVPESCFISEITLDEFKFGIEKNQTARSRNTS
jgi:predicted nucleic acid-binding protein